MRPPLLAGCCAAAALSLLVPAAPSYDAWSWLLWGREVARLDLSTAAGPAFKPLPVAVAALLAPAGAAAPELWLLVARAASVAAVVLAWNVARQLAGGSLVAGALAAVGVLLTEGFVARAATGDSEPLLVALALGAFARALAGRHGQALLLGAAASLVRVEAWPFVALGAAWCAWRQPGLRPAVLLGAVLVPAAWLVPEWLGSGQVLRSGGRALVPNPGAPALADVPALESLRRAAGLLPAPVLAGALAAAVLAARRPGVGADAEDDAGPGPRALVPAAAGVAWLGIVAVMAQAGFSGEERYALPGAAAVAVTGGVGIACMLRRAGPALAVAGMALVAVAGGARAAEVVGELRGAGSGAVLARTLEQAVAAAGGRDRLLACGRPAVGRYRGPMLAYVLDVHKRRVRADGRPAAVTFRSRLRDEPLSPPAPPGARVLARNPRWTVAARCDGPPPGRARRPAAGRPPR